MKTPVWTIGGGVVTVGLVVTLFAVRPELADNPNVWVAVMAMIPGLIAAYKGEHSAKSADEAKTQATEARKELKNGTMTKVVEEAIVKILQDKGIVLRNGDNDSIPNKRFKDGE